MYPQLVGKTASRFRFGEFVLDVDAFRLSRSGAPVALEPKALDLLHLLVAVRPRVVDKAEIFNIVWKDVAVTDNALTRVVAQLRKALDDDARTPRFIETVATRGYRFVADVEPWPEGPDDVTTRASSASTDSLVRGAGSEPADRAPAATARRGPLAAGAIMLVALVAALAAWQLRQQTAREAAGDRTLEALAALTPQQVTSGRGYEGFLAFSPDGNSIAFSSDRSGALEIYVESLAAGSATTPLTSNGGQNVQPAWSPDGQHIAYHEMAGNGIWVVPSRGGAARRIVDFGAHPVWSPDGRQIAFQSLPVNDINPLLTPGSLSTIWIVDVDGGAPRALTQAGTPAGPHLSPTWSPLTGELLFVSTANPADSGETVLWTIDAKGHGAPRRLVSDRRLSPELAIASDGRGLYFVGRNSYALWWLPLGDDGVTAGVPKPTGIQMAGSRTAQPAVSPDGKHLAWTTIDSVIHVWGTSPDGEQEGASSLTSGGMRYLRPVPSGDGRLAYVAMRSGANSSLFLETEGRARQLTTDDAFHLGPQWMPGRREIAVLSDHEGQFGFSAVDVESGRERPLFLLSEIATPAHLQPSTASPATNVVFSPDFTKFAMAAVADGVANVWVGALNDMHPAGLLVQRTFEREGGSYPVWSPDGRSIAYQCNQGTSTHVCVVGADGGSRQQLTSSPGQSWAGGWMDDSDTILFAARRNAVWNLASVALSDRQARQLTNFTEPRVYIRYPRWDAAAKRVVFERNESTARTWMVTLPPKR